MGKRILTINPGSTSTKVVLFDGEIELVREDLNVVAEEVRRCPLMLDQLPLRKRDMDNFFKKHSINVSELDMIVCRGGSMNGVHSGAYKIDEHVLTILENAPRTQHASSMAAFIGYELSQEYGVPCMFYDSPSATDVIPTLHLTGIPHVKRWASDHCLNSRAVAREYAKSIGKAYEDCNILVAHLGGGITLSFHSGGVMVDTVEDDAGPMSPQRAGRIPSTALIEMCYSGEYTKQEVLRMMRGEGGLAAYLGTQDTREVGRRIEEDGDKQAEELFWYMSYQVSKAIGEMSVVRCGKIDGIILTGGLAYSKMFTDWIIERVGFLAPVVLIPGEREMSALAQGGNRVLNGEEPLHEYRWLPKDCQSLEDVKAKYGRGEISTLY